MGVFFILTHEAMGMSLILAHQAMGISFITAHAAMGCGHGGFIHPRPRGHGRLFHSPLPKIAGSPSVYRLRVDKLRQRDDISVKGCLVLDKTEWYSRLS